MSGEESFCDVCGGCGKSLFNEICPYCNGGGEWNDQAASYIKIHLCQCLVWGRVYCPICKKKCHHDASLSPKQIIDSGFGGVGTAKSIPEKKEEELIVI